MKSLNLIESRNIDNDVAETLLPTLSNKKMKNVIGGGTECGLKFGDGTTYCGLKYIDKLCMMDISCSATYINGPTHCGSNFTTQKPCWFY